MTERTVPSCIYRFFLLGAGAEGGEEDDVADGGGAGDQHDYAVDADAQSACGGHAVFQGI